MALVMIVGIGLLGLADLSAVVLGLDALPGGVPLASEVRLKFAVLEFCTSCGLLNVWIEGRSK